MIYSANSLQVPSSSTTLNYHGQTIDINTQQLDTLRVLGSGSYGIVLAVAIEGYPDIKMAVKVIAWECILSGDFVPFTVENSS